MRDFGFVFIDFKFYFRYFDGLRHLNYFGDFCASRHCEEERRSNLYFNLVYWIASFLAMTQSVSVSLTQKYREKTLVKRFSGGLRILSL